MTQNHAYFHPYIWRENKMRTNKWKIVWLSWFLAKNRWNCQHPITKENLPTFGSRTARVLWTWEGKLSEGRYWCVLFITVPQVPRTVLGTWPALRKHPLKEWTKETSLFFLYTAATLHFSRSPSPFVNVCLCVYKPPYSIQQITELPLLNRAQETHEQRHRMCP